MRASNGFGAGGHVEEAGQACLLLLAESVALAGEKLFGALRVDFEPR